MIYLYLAFFILIDVPLVLIGGACVYDKLEGHYRTYQKFAAQLRQLEETRKDIQATFDDGLSEVIKRSE